MKKELGLQRPTATLTQNILSEAMAPPVTGGRKGGKSFRGWPVESACKTIV